MIIEPNEGIASVPSYYNTRKNSKYSNGEKER
jgi:hypothetical protein